jgi:hypothetical protein
MILEIDMLENESNCDLVILKGQRRVCVSRRCVSRGVHVAAQGRHWHTGAIQIAEMEQGMKVEIRRMERNTGHQYLYDALLVLLLLDCGLDDKVVTRNAISTKKLTRWPRDQCTRWPRDHCDMPIGSTPCRRKYLVGTSIHSAMI